MQYFEPTFPGYTIVVHKFLAIDTARYGPLSTIQTLKPTLLLLYSCRVLLWFANFVVLSKTVSVYPELGGGPPLHLVALWQAPRSVSQYRKLIRCHATIEDVRVKLAQNP